MLILSWQLTVMSLCITPIFIWLTVKVGRARREVATNTQKTLADLTAITEETLSVSGILLSKSFGRQRHEIDRYREENDRLTGFTIRQTMIGQSFFAIVGTFFSIMPALTYLVVGWVTSNNPAAMTAGTIVAFTTLQSRIFFPIGSMLQISNDVQTSFALFDRIFEYLDMPHDIKDAPDAVVIEPEQVRGQVRMRHVKFHYDTPPPDEVPVSPTDEAAALAVDQEGPRPWTLDDVDLEILPGQLAALVGPSGAGKTTITYLVPRLYDVQEGAVEIDGIDVRKHRARVDRRHRRGGHAGDVPVPHDDPPQPAVREARRDPGGAGGRSPRGKHPRPDRRAARGVRHDRGGARLQAVGRREATPGDRPRDPEGPPDPDPGRGDIQRSTPSRSGWCRRPSSR